MRYTRVLTVIMLALLICSSADVSYSLEENKGLGLQESHIFSVTVPTQFPMYLDSSGNVSTSKDCKIINNSSGPVIIDNIHVEEQNGWSIEGYNTDFSTYSVNETIFGMAILGSQVSENGELNLSKDYIINELDSIYIDYDAVFPAQIQQLNSKQIANVVITMNWADEALKYDNNSSSSTDSIDSTNADNISIINGIESVSESSDSKNSDKESLDIVGVEIGTDIIEETDYITSTTSTEISNINNEDKGTESSYTYTENFDDGIIVDNIYNNTEHTSNENETSNAINGEIYDYINSESDTELNEDLDIDDGTIVDYPVDTVISEDESSNYITDMDNNNNFIMNGVNNTDKTNTDNIDDPGIIIGETLNTDDDPGIIIG